jgi:DNA-binding transcriptional LysR family regulator
VAFRGSGELPDSSLVARKVASSYLALAASPAYLAARGTPQTIDDLAAHDCICPAHTGGHGTWRLEGPDGPVQVAVHGRLGASTGQAQRKAAEAGLGLCLQPINALRDSLRDGALVEVLPGVASAPAGLFVVYPSRRHVPRAVTAFVEMAVQRLVPALHLQGG